MQVPTNFNPNVLSSSTTQGADFPEMVFNQFLNYNSKQLILFDGKFITPKYLYESNRTFYDSLHNNDKSIYGITSTFKTHTDIGYSR